MRRHVPISLAAMALAVNCFMCQTERAWGAEPSEPNIAIVASLFPQYDFARRIAGPRAEVRLLLPPGVESHSYEPTPSDMKRVADADLFIHTGAHMEPWAGRVAAAAARPGGVTVVDASRGITLRPGEGGDGDHDHDHDHADGAHYHAFDPHIWLDPVLAMRMADNIADALARRDPAHAESYRANADALKGELSRLHAEFGAVVAASPRRTLVFGERFAFAYFFSRYGLEEVGPYNSCAPGAEPGLKAVIETIGYIRDNGISVIYRESGAANRISRVIVEETGVESVPVDSLHNPTSKQMAEGYNYVDVMRANMRAFAGGLR